MVQSVIPALRVVSVASRYLVQRVAAAAVQRMPQIPVMPAGTAGHLATFPALRVGWLVALSMVPQDLLVLLLAPVLEAAAAPAILQRQVMVVLEAFQAVVEVGAGRQLTF